LRHKWLSSERHHTAKSRRLFSNFVTTTPWRVARRVCQRQAKEGCDEEPSAWGGKLSEAQRTLPDQAGPGVTDERWIDLRFQEEFAWTALRESPAITGEVPEQQPPNSPSARTPSYWSGNSAEDIGSDASRRLH